MRKALDHLRKADPVIAGIIERVGPYAIEYREPTFENLARSIVYQQLSGKAAGTIFGRLLAATGSPMTPASILKMRTLKLRSLGLSGQKTDYLRDLARRTAKLEIDFERFPSQPDEEILAQLTAVHGVGVWTVQMFLMFALRRPDVLPATDLGIRNAVQKAYQLAGPPTPQAIAELARPWRPYCSVASWYLWRSLDPK